MTRAPRLLVAALLLFAGPLAASGVPPRPSDALVHDLSGSLGPASVADLERRADAVLRAGADVAVLVRFDRTDSDETRSDARRLLGEWGVESAPERADGVALVVNLREGDSRHGSAAIEVGKGLARDRLPPREVDRIWRDAMRPALRAGRIADAIAAALDALERTLREGPPRPSTASLAAAEIAAGTLLPFALLAATAATFATAHLSRRRGRGRASPGDRNVSLGPVTGGVLARRRLGDGAALGGLLELGASGAVTLEAGPGGTFLARPTGLTATGGYAAALLETVVARAGGTGVADLGTVPVASALLAKALPALRTDMTSRGLLDPRASRRSAKAVGGAGLTFAIAGLLVAAAAVGEVPGPAVAALVPFGAAFALLVRGATLPETTGAGDREGDAWRAWLAELEAAPAGVSGAVDPATALPFVLAAGRPDVVAHLAAGGLLSRPVPGWLSPTTSGDGAEAAVVCGVLVPAASDLSSCSADGGAGTGGTF